MRNDKVSLTGRLGEDHLWSQCALIQVPDLWCYNIFGATDDSYYHDFKALDLKTALPCVKCCKKPQRKFKTSYLIMDINELGAMALSLKHLIFKQPYCGLNIVIKSQGNP